MPLGSLSTYRDTYRLSTSEKNLRIESKLWQFMSERSIVNKRTILSKSKEREKETKHNMPPSHAESSISNQLLT